MAHIRLGLIGDNIATSRAPELHQVCGKLSGLAVTYDLLVPRDLNLDFDGAFDRAQNRVIAVSTSLIPTRRRSLASWQSTTPR